MYGLCSTTFQLQAGICWYMQSYGAVLCWCCCGARRGTAAMPPQKLIGNMMMMTTEMVHLQDVSQVGSSVLRSAA
jgi:hypothetical protein